jgi:hypothetical protein
VDAAERLRRGHRLGDLPRALGDHLLHALGRLRRRAAVARDLRRVGDTARGHDEHADRGHPPNAPATALLATTLLVVSVAVDGLEDHGTAEYAAFGVGFAAKSVPNGT